jgi:hypothetical protein
MSDQPKNTNERYSDPKADVALVSNDGEIIKVHCYHLRASG